MPSRASPETVYEAMHEKNAAVVRQRDFILAYVAAVETKFKDFKSFERIAKNTDDDVCNLLCEKGITGHFRVDVDVSAADLIRYVLTATCYGMRPDSDKTYDVLADLNQIVRATRLVDSKASWTTREAQFYEDELPAFEKSKDALVLKKANIVDWLL